MATAEYAATWMNLEIIILSEVSQTEKDKYHVISLICRILKKKDTNELIYKTSFLHLEYHFLRDLSLTLSF